MNAQITRKTWLVALFVAWLIFAALLAMLLSSTGGMNWRAALIIALPLSALGQAMAWAAQYPCRGVPLAQVALGRLILVHSSAGLLLTFLWVSFGRTLALWLDSGYQWAGTSAQYARMQTPLYGAGFSYYLMGVAFHYVLQAMDASRKAQERVLESTVRAREAELTALKAQINPHFLYNSLNSISALTSIDPARARDMCVALADFLRLTLGMGEKAVIPLREELGLLEKYCAIERVRFGERITLQEDVSEDTKDCLLPPLLLQPLFENAVRHGIAQMPDGGWIRLQSAREGNRIFVIVENSWDPEAGCSRKNGVGLKNVQRRLEARYGVEAQLLAKAEENVFRVVLQFPAEAEATK
jgi:two-component system, LytTR family, sensor histidine kinase AlgZ